MKSAGSHRIAARRPGTLLAILMVTALLMGYVTFASPVKAQDAATPVTPTAEIIATPPPETPAEPVIPTEIPAPSETSTTSNEVQAETPAESEQTDSEPEVITTAEPAPGEEASEPAPAATTEPVPAATVEAPLPTEEAPVDPLPTEEVPLPTEDPSAEPLPTEEASPEPVTPPPTEIPVEPPAPAFSVNPAEVYPEQDVSIDNHTTGEVLDWQWDFGDGNNSSAQNPGTHSYSNPGVYTIRLYVEGPGGSGEATQQVAVLESGGTVEAMFGYSVNGMIVCFIDQSTGNIATYDWDLSDGAGSNAQHPCHEYSAPGTYTISLRVVGVNGAESSTASQLLTLVGSDDPPLAAFSVTDDPIYTAEAFNFVDESTGLLSAWSWDFGDGSGSTDSAPRHEYASPGTYTATLTVYGPGGDSTASKTLTVIDRPPTLQCDFGVPGTVFENTPFTLEGQVENGGSFSLSYRWTVDDAEVSTGKNTTVSLPAGAHTITFEVTPFGGETCSSTRIVNVLPLSMEQQLSIGSSPGIGISPLAVHFTSVSQNIYPATLEWTFPGGVKAYGESAAFTFRQAGTHTVTLTGRGPLGTSTATTTIEVTTGSSIRAAFTPSRWQGVIPLEVCFTDHSTGDALSSWAWDFGSGETSADQNPCMTYTQPGTYNVSLRVSNDYGQNATATNRIQALNVSGGSSTTTISQPPANPGEPATSPSVVTEPGDETPETDDPGTAALIPGGYPYPVDDSSSSASPAITVYDPALSKIGFLPAGSTGLPGEALTWEITVTNSSALTETNIVVSDTIRSDLRIDRVQGDPGVLVSYSGQVVTATIASLAAGQSLTYSVDTTVLTGPLNGQFTNTAYPNQGLPASAVVNVPAAPANAPEPNVTGVPDASDFGGTPTCFGLEFTNAGNTGYGPYLLVILPPEVDFTSAAFLGDAITIVPATPPVPDNGLWIDPISGQTVSVPVGGQLIALRLPIGSVITGNPALEVELCLTADPLAEPGTPLPIEIYPGYEYGNTPTGSNGSIVNPVPDTGSITPLLVALEKTNDNAEDERTPGPSWEYSYNLTATVAAGQTLTNVVFSDAMPNMPSDLYFQYTGPTVLGGTCTRGASFIDAPDSGNGETLTVTIASVTSGGAPCTVTVTYSGYILDILDEDGSNNQTDIINTAALDYEHPTLPTPTLTDSNTISAEHVTVQKSASPGVVIPGNTVTYTLRFQTSDYATVDSLILVDVMPDGMDFVSGSGSVSIPGFSGAIVPTITTNPDGTLTLTFNVLATAGLPSIPPGSTGTLTYRGLISQFYRNPVAPVLASDTLLNTIDADFSLTDGASDLDDSGSGVSIQPVTLTKTTVTAPRNGVGFTHGESVRFRLTLSIPSGDAGDIVIEDFLPLPVFDASSFDFGLRSGTPGAMPFLNPDGICSTYPNAANPTYERCGVYVGPGNTVAGLLPTAITVDPGGNSITINLPDVVTTSPQTLQIDVVIAVVELPFADNLFLANQAHAEIVDSGGGSHEYDDVSYVRVGAPKLEIKKGVLSTSNPGGIIVPVTSPVDGNLSNVDAGDTITYQITVDNVGGARAFNVRITDPAIPGLINCTILSVRNGAGSSLAFTGNLTTGILLTNSLPGGRNGNAALARALVDIRCEIDQSVNPLEEVINTASVTFTGLGSSAVTAPPVADIAFVTIKEPTIAKALLSTNEAFTSGVNVAIGEQIRYRVSITVPEGTTDFAVLTDTLDQELAFMSLTDPALASITFPAGVTSSIGSGTTILGNAIVSSSGRVARLNFGVLSNTNRSAAPETIILEYTVVVLAASFVAPGDQVNNSASFDFSNDAISASAPAAIVVVPDLLVTKTPNPTSGDAGDIITFTIVIQHRLPQSTTTAFDVELDDLIPAGMVYVPGSLNSAGLAPTTLSDAGGNISAAWDAIAIEQSATLTFQVQIQNSVTPGQVITNNAVVGYDTLPGDNVVNQSPYNAQSDELSLGTTGSGSVTIIASTFTKVVTATSIASTGTALFDPAVTDLNIGEEVTFTLTAVLPEGTANNLTFVDTLPAGLSYVSSTFAAGSSITIPGSTTPTVAVNVITWMLGNVVNTPDNVINAGDRITLTVTAMVDNVPSNTNGTLLTNNASLTYDGSTPDMASAGVEIVEPVLQIVKSSPTISGDAGDTVIYTVVVSHAANSASDAYDVVITDALLPQLALVTPGQVTTTAGTIVTGNAAGDTTVRIELPVLARGSSVTITYRATLLNTVTSGQALTNTARVDYDDKAGAGGRASNATDTHTVTVITPTISKAVVSTSFAGTGSSQYDPALTDVGIGEFVTYEIVVELPEGTTPVTIIDNLPDVMIYVSSQVVSIGGNTSLGAHNGGTLSGVTLAVGISGVGFNVNYLPDFQPDQAVFSLGTVTNTPDGVTGETDRIRVQVTARLIDTVLNAAGQTKVNTGIIDYGSGSQSAVASIEVVEPVLALVKTFTPDTIIAGNSTTMTLVLSNTGTAAAYEISVTDVLNAALTLNSVTADTTGTAGTTFTNTSILGAAGQVRVAFNQLLPGESVTVTAVIGTPATAAAQSILNTANVTYDNLPTTSPEGLFDRNSSASGSDTLEIIRVIDLALTKTVNNPAPYPGEAITYTLTVTNNGPSSATNVKIVDVLPVELAGPILTPAANCIWTAAVHTFTCTFATLAPGASQVVTALVVPSISTSEGLALTNAAITYANESGTAYINETDATNNEDQVTINVRRFASIGDFVWRDHNMNGVQDAGEQPVVNLAVRLLDSGGVLLTTVFTDANGNYNFPRLRAGTYTVQLGTLSFDLLVFQDMLDAPGNHDGMTTVTVIDAQNRTDVDFAIIQRSSIGNRVWRDNNPANGIENTGEPGIHLVQLRLTGTDVFGAAVNQTVLTNSGNYSFGFMLVPGSYTVTVESGVPAGLVPTYDLDGIATPNTTAVTLGSGQTRGDVDFGYAPGGSIGDFVWRDADGDGVQDGGAETGIANSFVNLSGTTIFSQAVNRSVFTDANGLYTFTNVEAGTYTVSVSSGDCCYILASKDLDTVRDGQTVITLAANQVRTDVDFGFAPISTVGDAVWLDANGNGVRDSLENGINNVTVTLSGISVWGQAVNRTTTTTMSGFYRFENLPAGNNYLVSVSGIPAGTIQSYDLDGLATANSASFALAWGQNRGDVDFGYAPRGSVGDRLWRDTNNNGVQDTGEPGLPNVWVNLNGTDLYGHAVNLNALSGTNGIYNIPNVAPGSYNVSVLTAFLPVGLAPSYDLDGIATPHTTPITLAAGEDRTDVDFGYRPTGAIGDRLWQDTTFNNIQNPGEPGIPGVTVTLTGTTSFGEAINRTDITDANGEYLFSSVESGNYTVTLSGVPAGLVASYELDGTRNGTITFPLSAGINQLAIDFGFIATGSIGDRVWLDQDANNIQNGSEPGIAGVSVRITGTNALGVAVNQTVVTDATGSYLFPNMVQGTYTVALIAGLPADTIPGFDLDGGRNGTTVVVLAQGQNRTDVDFARIPTGIIGDTVWRDVNANAVQDAGEPGIGGVTVNLTGTDLFGVAVNRFATTAANGSYMFAAVNPGTYTVTVSGAGLTGLTSTYNLDAVLDNTTPGIVLAGGQIQNGVDFGYTWYVTIGDRIWLDTDGDRIQDAGEPGLGGLMVNLNGTTFEGNPVTRTVFTNATGAYTFAALIPGTYTVSVPSQPGLSGLVQTHDLDGILDNATTWVVNVVAPTGTLLADFGYKVGVSGMSLMSLSPLVQEMAVNVQEPGLTSATRLPDLGSTSTTTACADGCANWQLYHSNRTGTWQIYRLEPSDGAADDPNLSQSSGNDVSPSRSPDNQWVVFSSDRDGNSELYIASTTGDASQTQRITYNTTAIDMNPTWGPDSRIIYESNRDGNWNLFLFDVATGDEFRLTDDPASDLNAYWSPDGTRILFQSDRSGIWQIYALDLTTLQINLLSDGQGDDLDPVYSNDGEQIAFRSLRGSQNSTIYVMNADGSDVRAISDSNGVALNQSYSPDNQRIVYQSDLDGDNDIYIYDLQSGITRQLTDNDVNDFAPAWRCGTSNLYFTSEVDGNPEIYEVEALPITAPAVDVAKQAARLTNNPAADIYVQDAPGEENASREGELPGTIEASEGSEDYLQVDLSGTTPDAPLLPETPFQPIAIICRVVVLPDDS